MVIKSLDQMANETHINGSAKTSKTSAFFHRHLNREFLPVKKADGIYLILEDGRKICDATGGPAVGCLGWGEERVIEACVKQMRAAPYCMTLFYTTNVAEELAKELINGTKGQMAKAYIVNSGSEATEAALKLARQYFLEIDPPQPQRTRFIGRRQSYHGTTLGALAICGHAGRRAKFEPLLMENASQVSPCFAYRDKSAGETDEEYVARLAAELDLQFQNVGPDTVCAFMAEPIVGAALGCVPWVQGYFQAMHAVCQKYGALLIMDEVMCGMGRSGTLHTWEQIGVVPDIQTIGKGLGGGYQPVAGVLAGHRVVDALTKGTSAFAHGHTYQGHPVGCAAALEVQKIIREKGLLENVQKMGDLLSQLLIKQLKDHPYVGDIRGRGLFWGIEFVQDKKTKEPFPPEAHVAAELAELGLTEKYSIGVYPGSGTADGVRGDHFIVSPPYNVTKEQIEWIAATVTGLVEDYFAAKIFA